MVWIELAALAAVLEYLVFGVLVGRARGRYGVAAPAVTGHPVFERLYRVQMNTLESLVLLLPGLWLAGRYWPSAAVAGLGFVFVAARAWYAVAYARDPGARAAPFAIGMTAVLVLLLMAGLGALRTLLA